MTNEGKPETTLNALDAAVSLNSSANDYNSTQANHQHLLHRQTTQNFSFLNQCPKATSQSQVTVVHHVMLCHTTNLQIV